MTNQSWRQMLSLHRDKRIPCMQCMSTITHQPITRVCDKGTQIKNNICTQRSSAGECPGGNSVWTNPTWSTTAIANLPRYHRTRAAAMNCFSNRAPGQTFWARHRSIRSSGQGHANEASEVPICRLAGDELTTLFHLDMFTDTLCQFIKLYYRLPIGNIHEYFE